MAKQRKPRPSKSTRAFYPPRIAAATANVISEKVPKPPEVPVQGIPLSLFKPVTNRQGVLAGAVTLRIDSIPADADHPNDIDEVSWWLNGNRMEGVAINPANRDDVWFFNVFLDDLLDTVTNEILYKTRRPGGNETPSTALWVLCSKTLPGGNDVPGTGAHPGLQLSLPTELGNPALIGKDEVEAGVLATYTYSHMKAYDTITLDINGEQFTVKLDPDDVGASFSALIDRTMFEWVGSLDNCPFRYRVRDQLGNFTHNHRWSKVIYANIDLERVFFPKPVLRERADDTTDDPETVKLDLLEGKPLLVMIRADDSLYKIGDIVTAYYWLDDSTEKASEPGEFPADEFGDLDKCIVYIPNDQLVSGARLQVRFEVERPKGDVIGHSKSASAKIIGNSGPILNIDTSIMILNGLKLVQDYGWKAKDVVGNVRIRQAWGGRPPYSYRSSDEMTASVTTDGKVAGLKNGNVTVFVSDTNGATLQYPVQVSNVFRVVADNRLMTVSEMVNWIQSVGGERYVGQVPQTILDLPLNFVDLSEVLFPVPDSWGGGGHFRWFGQIGSGGYFAVLNTNNGQYFQKPGEDWKAIAPIAFVRT